MRERLIELLNNVPVEMFLLNGVPMGTVHQTAEALADHLLANGVIVPPCKVGDTVYYHGGIHKSLVKSAVVEEIIINSCGVGDLLVTSEDGVTFENSVAIFFLTKEEAEAALKGGAE